MKRMLIFSFLAIVLLFGCIDLSGKPPVNNTNVTEPPLLPTVKPSFSISSPVSLSSIEVTDEFTDVPVTLTTSNLLVKSGSSTNKDGEGHFKISVDDGPYASFFGKSYTLPSVALGSHTITVELVNNDGTPYSPAITKSATFTLEKAAPLEYVPQTYEVEIKDFTFVPDSINLKVGDSITFKNTGAYPRSATSTGNFDTKVIASGTSATIVFDKVGTFSYFSLTHMAMKGTVIVESNGTTGSVQ